jgi:hypothetical protein
VSHLGLKLGILTKCCIGSVSAPNVDLRQFGMEIPSRRRLVEVFLIYLFFSQCSLLGSEKEISVARGSLETDLASVIVRGHQTCHIDVSSL